MSAAVRLVFFGWFVPCGRAARGGVIRAAVLGSMACGVAVVGLAQTSQPASAPVFQRARSAGLDRFRPGAWGEVGVEVMNHTDESTEVVSGLYFDGDTRTEFSRRMWLPANSRRTTWIPARPPEDGPRELKVHRYLRGSGGDTGSLLRASDEQVLEEQILGRAEAPMTVILDDWLTDDAESLMLAKELTITMRLAARFNRNVTELGTHDLPAFQHGLDAVDQIVLAGNQVAKSPTGLACLRAWLHRGGRMWILLDQVELATVELLMGDMVRITEVDRTRLTEIQLQNLLKHSPSGEVQQHAAPVEFVRVIAPDADIRHEVNGWPASFLHTVGRGRVVFTTVSAAAWMRPRLAGEQMARPEQNSRYVARQGLEEVADYLTRPLDPPPLVPEDFGPLLSESVGYSIPSRGLVVLLLTCFWGGLLGAGFWLLHRRQLEWLALIGPLMAVLVAAPLVVLGERARRAIPRRAAVAQVVQVGPGPSSIHSSGAAAVFLPEPAVADIGGRRGQLLMPQREPLGGSVRQIIWTDLQDWHWQNLTLPAGLHLAATEQHASVSALPRATATFGPDGVYGRLDTGLHGDALDSIIATESQHVIAVRIQQDGSFSAGKGDVLAPGVYLADAILTDEQRRRQVVFQRMLGPRPESRYPHRPTVLAWTQALQTDLLFPDGMETSASTLLAIPLEIQPPVPDSAIFIPSPFLPFTIRATGDGMKSPAYDERTGQWQRTSYPAAAVLRFVVPEALRPLNLTGGTVFVSLRAPLRRVELSTGAFASPVRLASLDNAVGSYEFSIEPQDGLVLDDNGALHLHLTVSEVQTAGAGQRQLNEADRSWKIGFLRIELSGHTAASSEQDGVH